MFEVSIEGRYVVRIEGCPRSGIEAIDFRRAHGLPEEPYSIVYLPGFQWRDEQFVRQLSDKASDSADIAIRSVHCHQTEWRANAVGDIWAQGNGCPNILPHILAAYLAGQCPETGRALVLDIYAGTERSRLLALQESDNIIEVNRLKEAAIASARELLKDELAALTYRAEVAEQRVRELEEVEDDE